jgi:uncharacterized membrane protein
MYEVRWRLTGKLGSFALFIAPRGAARDRIVQALEEVSEEIVKAVTDRNNEGENMAMAKEIPAERLDRL